MKIQCQSCQAKYTIADEKVLGKVVKIRCKKCSATIVINGNEQPAAAEDNADTHVFDYTAQGGQDQWTVNVADGDQRTMTAPEIAAEYRAGVINDETYCWKDGMADWLPLRDIEQLYGAVQLGPRPSLADDHNSMPPAHDAGAAAAGGDLFGGASSPAGSDDQSPFAGHANGNGNGGGLFGDTGQAARRGGRGQGADLFGGVAAAGGEEDVMTSAASGGGGGGGGGGGAMGAAVEDSKMTGQRNENSVLFSLSALTDSDKGPPASSNKTTATSDGSGLIDIRALSAGMGASDSSKDGARVDDIMNLSGGGAFGAALAAPILAPPALESPDAMGGGAQGEKNNKMLIFAILGGAALIAIGIIVAVIATRSPPPPQPVALGGDPTGTPTGTGAAAPTDTPPTTPTTTSTEPAAVAPTAATQAAATPAPHGKTGPTTPAAPGKPAAATVAKADPTPPPATPSKPTNLADAIGAAAGKKPTAPPPPATGGSAPFDRGAAAAALGGVNVSSCKKADGPTGSGHVTVTFAPNGSVASAAVDGGPFPGTAVGGCIAGRYRGARVPAFSGGPVRVGKSFTIN
ncbi:MAG: zinc-ribbon domain-containing protein [Polyangiaceae bacterium]